MKAHFHLLISYGELLIYTEHPLAIIDFHKIRLILGLTLSLVIIRWYNQISIFHPIHVF